MLPVTNTSSTASASAVQPVNSTTDPAALAPAAGTASTVDFSDLARFLSSVALSRRQLLELQGSLSTTQPTAAELALLTGAADNLAQSFNQLPAAPVDQIPPLTDQDGGGTLAERLAEALRREGADTPPGGPVSATTLAGLGLTLGALAPASGTDILNVNAGVLRAAFELDRDGTLALLTRTSDEFNALGNAAARQASTAAQEDTAQERATLAQRTETLRQELDRADRGELIEQELQARQEAARVATAQESTATQAELQARARLPADQQLTAREDQQTADRIATELRQANRATADRVNAAARDRPGTRQAPLNADAAEAAAETRARAAVQAAEAQRAALAKAANSPQAPTAANPALAAAIAAYNTANIATASGRPPAPAPRTDRVPPTPPVTPVQPVDIAGGDTTPPRR